MQKSSGILILVGDNTMPKLFQNSGLVPHAWYDSVFNMSGMLGQIPLPIPATLCYRLPLNTGTHPALLGQTWNAREVMRHH